MTYEELLNELAATGEDLPREAMQAALDGWDECGPRFAALLAAYAEGADRSERTERALFYVFHLLAERRETAALAPLCRLLLDVEAADLTLGDALTASLSGALINMFDGDPAPLKAVVEAEQVQEAVRYEALMALAYLTRTGRVAEAEMRGYLAHLRTQMQPQGESFVWLGWVLAVVDLGWLDLADEAEEICRIGFCSAVMARASDVRRDLRRTLADPSRMAGFDRDGVRPFGSAITELESWTWPVERRGSHDDEPWDPAFVPQEPVINPLRHVGRNDPCPCGSGRKHKKCCLV